MVGQWLGANAGERVDKLVLSNTSSYFADKSLWHGRLKTVREKGWRRSSTPIWSAGSPRNSAKKIRKRWRGCARCS
jgi:hypothetical protein